MKIVPAIPEFRQAVAQNMRQSDRDEAWLAWRMNPRQAVEIGFDDAWASAAMLTERSEVAGVFGVTKGHMIWMLCTDAELTFSDRRFMVETGRKLVDAWLQEQRFLWNYVALRNTAAKRFITALGFEIGQPMPVGPSAALFHRFWRCR